MFVHAAFSTFASRLIRKRLQEMNRAIRSSWPNQATPTEDAKAPLRENVSVLRLHAPQPNQTEGAPSRIQKPRQATPAKRSVWARLLSFLGQLASRLPFRGPPKTHGRNAQELIRSAMRNRAMLRLRYEGHFGYLDVEPHGLGRDRAGKLLLWCYELANLQEGEAAGGWRLLTVADIVTAYPSGEFFTARDWPTDSHFDTLIAQVEQEAE